MPFLIEHYCPGKISMQGKSSFQGINVMIAIELGIQYSE
jgi:hypothetical protein